MPKLTFSPVTYLTAMLALSYTGWTVMTGQSDLGQILPTHTTTEVRPPFPRQAARPEETSTKPLAVWVTSETAAPIPDAPGVGVSLPPASMAPIATTPTEQPVVKPFDVPAGYVPEVVAVAPAAQRLADGPPTVMAGQSPAPVYPLASWQDNQTGSVLLSVRVAVDGSVTQVQVTRGSGFPDLDAAAVDAVQHWHYRPAVHNGVASEATTAAEVAFRITPR